MIYDNIYIYTSYIIRCKNTHPIYPNINHGQVNALYAGKAAEAELDVAARRAQP